MRPKAVLGRKPRDHVLVDAGHQVDQILLDACVGEAVHDLERREQEQHLFERVAIQLPVGTEQRVREPVGYPAILQVVGQRINVLAPLLDGGVLIGVDVPGEDVHDAPVLGEARRDLLGQKEVRLVDERQPTRQGVVVGEGDQIHPAQFAQIVLLDRIDVALRTAEVPTVPLGVGHRSRRVQVEIAPRRARAGFAA